MNEQLQNTINTILLNAIEQAKAGTEFLAGQVPDIVQQLLTWNLYSSVLGSTLWFLLTLALLYLMYWINKQDTRNELIGVIVWVLGGAGVTLFVAICKLFDVIKICVAPKVWLLEYASRLIQQ